MHLNTTIEYNQQRYGVYWTSQYAKHIQDNHLSPTHGADHVEVVQILKRAEFKIDLAPVSTRKDYFVFLSQWKGAIWETYVYLVAAENGWPARCVIVTCYKSNKQHYRAYFAS